MNGFAVPIQWKAPSQLTTDICDFPKTSMLLLQGPIERFVYSIQFNSIDSQFPISCHAHHDLLLHSNLVVQLELFPDRKNGICALGSGAGHGWDTNPGSG